MNNRKMTPRYDLKVYDSAEPNGTIYTANTIEEINEFILALPDDAYEGGDFELVDTLHKLSYELDYDYYYTTDNEDKFQWCLVGEEPYEGEGIFDNIDYE